MKKGIPQWDYTQCVACGVCTEICPTECIELSHSGIGPYKTKMYPDFVKKEDCTSCGMCEKSCPADAVAFTQ